MKKIFIYTCVAVSCIAAGAASWIYYPQYKIYKMKQSSVQTEQKRISYIDYLGQTSKFELHHLALGDSIIRGIGAGKNEGFVEQFSAELKQQTNKQVVLQNEGVPGITSSGLLSILQAGKLDEAIRTADIITINVGGNDILRAVQKKDYVKAMQSFDMLQTTFVNNLSQITEKIKEINPEAVVVFLELYNPLNPKSSVYAVADQLLPKWNIKVYEAAGQFDVSLVIETTKVINAKNAQFLSPDGVHPNAVGYAAISKQMLQQLQQQAVKAAL